MTEVASSRPEMSALAPPAAQTVSSRNASPCRSPSSQRSPTEISELLQDKERRVQKQLERCAEERGRKMEEQKKKEQKRRANAEEKKRQQEKAEKERLEALVRRRNGGAERRGGGGGGNGGGGVGGEARDHLDNRPKRWTWGGPPDGVEVGDFLSPSVMEQQINKQLSSSSAALHSPERASPSNHRPYRSSSNRRSIAGFPEETSKARTPTGETPNTPSRSSSFRSNSKGPATPKRVRSNRSRAQSPCSPGQYPPSPLRHRATTPGHDDRNHTTEVKGHSTLERKATKSDSSEKKIPKSTSRELNAESPGTPTGRSVGGTTDAEEASRLLAERRRLARIQKEQEERQRQEEERLRAEEEQRRLQEARERQERAARQAEEERARREEEKRNKEDEERRQKEQRWRDMQEQLDKEREEAFLRAQKEADRKRQERELLHIQEEQERQQRKKRIEEIMKRTRKSEVEPLSGAAVPDTRAEVAVPSEEEVNPAEAPVIMLGPLENKSCVDELSDGVQSMDVSSPSVSISPVSRDEQASAHEFSPVADGTDGCPLDQLMDMDAHGRGQRHVAEMPPYPKMQAGSGVGDLNKNLLIQAYSAASESSQLIHSVGPSKLDVQ
ncbi:uncharacterized protein map7d2b isoform X5 [Halichoeres trimaculatus]|uniref:uncharacterized protein map7d2b isoform X5 n=1 Tax=Halichoeres trimaculatus TaxID=147232 RepID=UPI003D9E4D95